MVHLLIPKYLDRIPISHNHLRFTIAVLNLIQTTNSTSKWNDSTITILDLTNGFSEYTSLTIFRCFWNTHQVIGNITLIVTVLWPMATSFLLSPRVNLIGFFNWKNQKTGLCHAWHMCHVAPLSIIHSPLDSHLCTLGGPPNLSPSLSPRFSIPSMCCAYTHRVI